MFETINKHFVEFSNHQSFSERTLTTEVMALVAELNDIGLQVKQGKLATIVTQVCDHFSDCFGVVWFTFPFAECLNSQLR